MKLSKAWIVASKDLSVFRTRKSVVYSTVLFPLFVSIGLPLVVRFAGSKSGGIPVAMLPRLLNSFAFFFIIGAAVLPTAIASYSLVGEKVEKSLEPLLATPTSDGEILLGKSLAAFLPPIVSIYVGASIFMVLIDRSTYTSLGYLYFPNWSMGVILLLVAPLTAIFSVEFSVIMSARMNDVRTTQQLGGLMALPFGAVYVSGEIGLVSLDTTNLLFISVGLLAIDVILFYVSTLVFRREEILTRWK
jgi:ABC-2 type transport system permease protein